MTPSLFAAFAKFGPPSPPISPRVQSPTSPLTHATSASATAVDTDSSAGHAPARLTRTPTLSTTSSEDERAGGQNAQWWAFMSSFPHGSSRYLHSLQSAWSGSRQATGLPKREERREMYEQYKKEYFDTKTAYANVQATAPGERRVKKRKMSRRQTTIGAVVATDPEESAEELAEGDQLHLTVPNPKSHSLPGSRRASHHEIQSPRAESSAGMARSASTEESAPRRLVSPRSHALAALGITPSSSAPIAINQQARQPSYFHGLRASSSQPKTPDRRLSALVPEPSDSAPSIPPSGSRKPHFHIAMPRNVFRVENDAESNMHRDSASDSLASGASFAHPGARYRHSMETDLWRHHQARMAPPLSPWESPSASHQVYVESPLHSPSAERFSSHAIEEKAPRVPPRAYSMSGAPSEEAGKWSQLRKSFVKSTQGTRRERIERFLIFDGRSTAYLRIFSLVCQVVALALAIRLRDLEISTGIIGVIGSSPILTIIYAPITVVHSIIIMWKEAFGRPIGLWGLRSKMTWVCLDLLFIALWSSDVSLVISDYISTPLGCTAASPWWTVVPEAELPYETTHGSTRDQLCDEQAAMIAFTLVVLIMYVLNMVLSLFRIFERIRVIARAYEMQRAGVV